MPDQPLKLTLQISAGDGADAREIDRLTRNLLRELRQMDVESAEIARSNQPSPSNTKGDPITIGAIVLGVSVAVLPKLIEVIDNWKRRQTIQTIKVTIGENAVEVPHNASNAEVERIIKLVQAIPQPDKPQRATLRPKE